RNNKDVGPWLAATFSSGPDGRRLPREARLRANANPKHAGFRCASESRPNHYNLVVQNAWNDMIVIALCKVILAIRKLQDHGTGHRA
ncbi:MAG: hypothetical protein ACXWLR_13965, partial [Myxococcales bacterium]